jgi:hypothetical protein
MIVTSEPKFWTGRRPVPYGPHRMMGVLELFPGHNSWEILPDSWFNVSIFNRPVSPSRH